MPKNTIFENRRQNKIHKNRRRIDGNTKNSKKTTGKADRTKKIKKFGRGQPVAANHGNGGGGYASQRRHGESMQRKHETSHKCQYFGHFACKPSVMHAKLPTHFLTVHRNALENTRNAHRPNPRHTKTPHKTESKTTQNRTKTATQITPPKHIAHSTARTPICTPSNLASFPFVNFPFLSENQRFRKAEKDCVFYVRYLQKSLHNSEKSVTFVT